MHGEIISFYVGPEGNYIVMTVSNPDESNTITVQASMLELATMANASPLYIPRTPPQTATPEPRDAKGARP
jgi:hypothetical protein